jgi:dihydrofolate reductase
LRRLRYSINVTLDGCVDHRAGSTNEELHRFWAETLAEADALLFGRVTYEMMQSAWRWPASGVRPEWMADWMEPFARTIDAAKKYVVSKSLTRVDGNAELLRGDMAKAVEQLKREPGKRVFVGGVTLPLALADFLWGASYTVQERARRKRSLSRTAMASHRNQAARHQAARGLRARCCGGSRVRLGMGRSSLKLEESSDEIRNSRSPSSKLPAL